MGYWLGVFSMGMVVSVQSVAGVDIQHWQTKDGAKVYFVENHMIPMMDLEITFNAGDVYATKDKGGLAEVTRYLMKKGAGDLDEYAIVNQMAEVGAIISGSTGSDSASFSLRTTTDASRKAKSLAILNKILHQPSFPMKVLEASKIRYEQNLEENNTLPAYIAASEYRKAVFGKSPYGVDGMLSVKTLNNMTRADIMHFYQQYYVPQNAVIALVGDLSLSEAKAIAEKLSSGLPKGNAPALNLNLKTDVKAIEKHVKHPSTQAHIMMGMPSIAMYHPDRLALLVGNYILGGGGFESRLTRELRQKRGMVYGVSSKFVTYKHAGHFMVSFKTKKEQADEAKTLVKKVISDFIQQGVTAQELADAKANITGQFPFETDSNSKILDYLSLIGFYDLPLTYLDDYNANVEAITASAIKTAFEKHLDIEKFVMIVVGEG